MGRRVVQVRRFFKFLGLRKDVMGGRVKISAVVLFWSSVVVWCLCKIRGIDGNLGL